MTRLNGYYWIRLDSKRDDPFTENGWEVAYYSDDGWCSLWDGGYYNDSDLLEIDEQRLFHE